VSEAYTSAGSITFLGTRVQFDASDDVTLEEIAAASGYTVEEIVAANHGRLDSILSDDALFASDVVFLPGNPRINVVVDAQSDEIQTPQATLPAYMVRTEDDLLRWLWVEVWDRSDPFDRNAAQARFEALVTNAVFETQRQLISQSEFADLSFQPNSGSNEINRLFQQLMSYGAGDTQALGQFLDSLTFTQISALQHELEKVGVTLADLGIVITDSNAALASEALNYYEITQDMAGGATLPFDAGLGYDPRLAMNDYFRDNFGTINQAEVEEQLLQAAIDLIIGMGSSYDFAVQADRDLIRRQILLELETRGITNPSLEDLIGFIEEVAQGALPYTPDGMTDQMAHASLFASNPEWERAYRIAAEYHDALALDQLRQIVYDPNWNPAEDEVLFELLLTAIDGTPRDIDLIVAKVDIGFVQDGLRAYWEQAKALHDWRLELKAYIDQIELQMLERADGEQEPLWWLLEIPLSILFEPLDWLFTIRDVLQGDMIALVGLLPFVPHQLGDVLRNISNAGRYTNLSTAEHLSDLMGGVNRALARNSELSNLFGSTLPFESSIGRVLDLRPFEIVSDQGELLQHWNNFTASYYGPGIPNGIQTAEDFLRSYRWGQSGLQHPNFSTLQTYGREIGFTIDPLGNVEGIFLGQTSIVRTRSGQYEVRYTVTPAPGTPRIGRIFVHNHPRSIFLSSQDIITNVSEGYFGVRAITERTTVSLIIDDMSQGAFLQLTLNQRAQLAQSLNIRLGQIQSQISTTTNISIPITIVVPGTNISIVYDYALEAH
jgi:hypothetical protein